MPDNVLVEEIFKQRPDLRSMIAPEPGMGQILHQNIVEETISSTKMMVPYVVRAASEMMESLPTWLQSGSQKMSSTFEEIDPEGHTSLEEKSKKWSDDTIINLYNAHQQQIEDDPKLSAYYQWVADTKWSDDWFDKELWMYAVSSGIGSSAQMGIAALAGGMINPALAPVTASAVMFGLEGGSSLKGGMHYLMQPKESSPEEVQNEIESIYEQTRDLTPIAQKQAAKDDIDSRFFFKDGRIFKKGLSPSEAIEAGIITSMFVGVGNAFLERTPARILTESATGKTLKKNIYDRFISKAADGISKIPGVGKMSRIASKPTAAGRVFKQAWSETGTELAQYADQVMIETAPGIGFRDESFSEEWDWNEAITSAVGGFGGGATISTTVEFMKSAGVYDNIKNTRRLIAKDLQPDEFVTKYNKATKKFDIYYQDDKKFVKMDEKTLENYKGDPISASYDRKSEALKAIRNLETKLSNERGQQYLKNNKALIGATIKVDGNKVSIVDKKGKEILSKIARKEGGKPTGKERRKTPSDTGPSVSEIKSHFSKVIKFTDTLNKAQIKQGKSPVNVDELAKGSEQHKALTLRTFMGIEETSDEEGDIISTEEAMNKDALKSILRDRGENVLESAGVSSEEFLEEVEKSFDRKTRDEFADLIEGKSEVLDLESGPVVDTGEDQFIGEDIDDEGEGIDEDGDVPVSPEIKDEPGINLETKSPEQLQSDKVELQKQIDSGTLNPMDLAVMKGRLEKVNEALKTTDKTSPKGVTVHSGGAKGADTVFQKSAEDSGHIVKAHSFKGHAKGNKSKVEHTEEELKEADSHLEKANKTLNRKFPPSNNYTLNLLRRNYFQVKDSEQVIAVSRIHRDKVFGGTFVTGGTAWATQMGIDMGKPVYVFDMNTNQWHEWDGKEYSPSNAPTITGDFAGIGSRNITKEGIKAIQSLFISSKPKQGTLFSKPLKSQVFGGISDKLWRPSSDFDSESEYNKITKKMFHDNLKHMIDKVQKSTGKKLKYKIINDPTNPDKGKWDPETETITFNMARADEGTPIHEFLHPFVSVLRKSNPKLFNSLLDQIDHHKSNDEFKQLIIDKYENNLSEDLLREEILVHFLEKYAKRRMPYKRKTLRDVIDKFIKWLKELFHGKDPFVEFSLGTTIQEVVTEIINPRGRLLADNNILYEKASDIIDDIALDETEYSELSPEITLSDIEDSNLKTPDHIIDGYVEAFLYDMENHMPYVPDSALPDDVRWDKFLKYVNRALPKRYRGYKGKHIKRAIKLMKKDNPDSAKLIVDSLMSEILKHVPQIKKIPDDVIKDLEASSDFISGVSYFSFKMYKLLDKKTLYQINSLPGMKDARELEKEHMVKFQEYFAIKFPGRTKIRGEELLLEYKNWNDELYNLYWVKSKTMSMGNYMDSAIGQYLGPGEMYRITIYKNLEFYKGAGHAFDDFNLGMGYPLAWYAVRRFTYENSTIPDGTPGGMLYEFQSDAMDKIIGIPKIFDDDNIKKLMKGNPAKHYASIVSDSHIQDLISFNPFIQILRHNAVQSGDIYLNYKGNLIASIGVPIYIGTGGMSHSYKLAENLVKNLDKSVYEEPIEYVVSVVETIMKEIDITGGNFSTADYVKNEVLKGIRESEEKIKKKVYYLNDLDMAYEILDVWWKSQYPDSNPQKIKDLHEFVVAYTERDRYQSDFDFLSSWTGKEDNIFYQKYLHKMRMIISRPREIGRDNHQFIYTSFGMVSDAAGKYGERSMPIYGKRATQGAMFNIDGPLGREGNGVHRIDFVSRKNIWNNKINKQSEAKKDKTFIEMRSDFLHDRISIGDINILYTKMYEAVSSEYLRVYITAHLWQEHINKEEEKSEIDPENVKKLVKSKMGKKHHIIPDILSYNKDWFEKLITHAVLHSKSFYPDMNKVLMPSAMWNFITQTNTIASGIYAITGHEYLYTVIYGDYEWTGADKSWVEGNKIDEVLSRNWEDKYPKTSSAEIDEAVYLSKEILIGIQPSGYNIQPTEEEIALDDEMEAYDEGPPPPKKMQYGQYQIRDMPFGDHVLTPDQVVLVYDSVAEALYLEAVEKGHSNDTFKFRPDTSPVPILRTWTQIYKSKSLFIKALQKFKREYNATLSWEFVNHPDDGTRIVGYHIDVSNVDQEKLEIKRFSKIIDENDVSDPSNELEAINEAGISSSRTSSAIALRQIFNTAYKHVVRLAKQKVGKKAQIDLQHFKITMLDTLPLSAQNDFKSWWTKLYRDNEKRKGSIEEKLPMSWKILLGIYVDPKDTESDIIDIMNDNREGLDMIAKLKQTDEREININEISYFRELGIIVSKTNLGILRGKASKSESFDEWVRKDIPKYTTKIYRSLTDRQIDGLKQFFFRVKSSLRTNSGITDNERDNLEVSVDGKNVHISYKGIDNKKTGNKNAQYEKVTLFEYNVTKGRFMFLRGTDVLTKGRKTDDDGKVFFPTREAYGFISDMVKDGKVVFNLNILKKNLKKMNLAVAFSRGDARKLGIVNVEPYLTLGSNMKKLGEYWKKEVKDGFVTRDQANNFMGIWQKDVVSKMSPKDKQFFYASQIAIHEGLKEVIPGYLSFPGAEVMKRLKAVFTPVTISDEMPPMSVKVFKTHHDSGRWRNISFVHEGVETKAIRNIRGVGKKYIGDGGTFTSQNYFDLIHKILGLKRGLGKSKTVIYDKHGENVLIAKHQHFLPEPGLEIYENYGKKSQKLIAKVNEDGNIEDADGNHIDFLMTRDEAKILDGYMEDEIFEIGGSSIGHVKFDEHISVSSKHGVQWYNHVFDDGVMSEWKNTILPRVTKSMRDIFRISIDTGKKNAEDKISEFVIDNAGKEDEGFIPAIVEAAKLGAGLHLSMEPMMNTLVQTRAILGGLSMDDSKGTMADLVPNTRGDLGEGEIALSSSNSKEVYKLYALSEEISISDALSTDLDDINEWLLENKVEVFVTRYPVPHKAGAYIARVKRLHSRKGLVEINHIDGFARLESDYDGDEIQIEFLEDSTTEAFKNFFDTIDHKGINLIDFVNKKESFDLSIEQERDKLIEAITYGRRAIGEISNVQSVYGQLMHSFDHAIIDGKKVVLKQPDDRMKSNIITKDGKPHEDTVSGFLRIYLQAAVDNAKFMLLSKWKYTQETLFMSLFKNEDGSPISKDQYRVLKLMIDMHKIPGRIRNGYDFDQGRYRLNHTVKQSKLFHSYIQDRVGYWMNKYSNSESTVSFEKAVFKDVTSPIEDIALSPYKNMSEMVSEYNVSGFDGTPFSINQIVHENAHIDAVRQMSKNITGLLIRSEKSVPKGSTVKEEIKKGGTYNAEMGNSFYRILEKIKSVGYQTLERNDELIEWKEEYTKKFQSLSDTAQIAATHRWLTGWTIFTGMLEKTTTKSPKVFPPASSSKNEYQTLHAPTLIKFFKHYNKSLREGRNEVPTKENLNYQTISEIAEKACK